MPSKMYLPTSQNLFVIYSLRPMGSWWCINCAENKEWGSITTPSHPVFWPNWQGYYQPLPAMAVIWNNNFIVTSRVDFKPGASCYWHSELTMERCLCSTRARSSIRKKDKKAKYKKTKKQKHKKTMERCLCSTSVLFIELNFQIFYTQTHPDDSRLSILVLILNN